MEEGQRVMYTVVCIIITVSGKLYMYMYIIHEYLAVVVTFLPIQMSLVWIFKMTILSLVVIPPLDILFTQPV